MKSALYYIPSRLRKILIALARALVTIPDDIQIRDADNELINRCEMILREFPPLMRVGFVFGIYVFDLCPFFFVMGPRRFLRLSPEQQKQYAQAWLTSSIVPIRELFKAVRAMVMICYFSHHDIWDYIGYHPKEYAEERIKLRQELLARGQQP